MRASSSEGWFVGADGCLSADDILAHVDSRLEGAALQMARDHIDGCSGCRVVMAEAARVATATLSTTRVPRTLADSERIANRYDIRRFIARGGMGEVYEAFDSALGETVALKTLTITAVDQTDAIKRLLAEVRIARKVTHPNVCRILEFGTYERGGATDQSIPFLTMPLLRGETLAQRLERSGRLPPLEALRILSELVSGLAAIHEVGVVHRDFKSDNVFLVRGDDDTERAIVMDFGLARALETSGDKNKTTGRLFLGTPAYMAPEQVEGKTITKAVDLYALGVVAFEMITGRVPFEAESAAAVALARLQQTVISPSSLVDGLDRRWDAFIRRCLRRSPEHRFATMADVMAALGNLRNQGSRSRSWRPGAALALGAAAVAATIWIASRRARPGPSAQPVEVAARGTTQLSKTTSTAVPAPTVKADRATLTATRSSARPRSGGRGRSQSMATIPSLVATPPLATPEPPAVAAPFEKEAESRPPQPDDLIDPFVRTKGP